MDEETTTILEDSRLVPVAVGLLALGAGLAIGYFLGRRKRYEIITLDEDRGTRPPKVIIDAKDLNSMDEVKEPQLQEIKVNRLDNTANEKVSITVNQTPVSQNVFAAAAIADDDWDYDKEIKRRNPLSPYVIHRDEFFAEEMESEGYLQSTLTYYAGDDTLVDEDDKPIYNHHTVVGELKFGHGSGDPNCVYVRNMTRNCEYEIVRDPGLYSVEVLGLEMENEAKAQDIKHSRERKFRPE